VLERWCWNWQTGMVEGHVPKGVEVQVLSSAYETEKNPRALPGILFYLTQDLMIFLNSGGRICRKRWGLIE
jgi:hypothetical protein